VIMPATTGSITWACDYGATGTV